MNEWSLDQAHTEMGKSGWPVPAGAWITLEQLALETIGP